MNKNLELATKFEEDIIGYRRHIHQNPEIGFYLPNTAQYIIDKLSEMGIEGRLCGKLDRSVADKFMAAGFGDSPSATGVVATIGHGSPCVLLRGDIDALPMPETTGLEFSSKNQGIMHACGHDSHGAMLLGAAKILKERESELKGTVKLMFQIGEEWGCGSKLMIDDGLLENPKVDVAFAIHVQPENNIGTVGYSKGIASASMDTWVLEIQGKGGHSSMPHNSIDPNVIATQLYTQLNLLPGREAPPDKTFSLMVGSFQGGFAANIIPDTAKMSISMRTLDTDVRDHLAGRIPEFVEHMVAMWRGKYTSLHFHTPSTFTNGNFIDEVLPTIKEIAGEENVEEVPPLSGTEDFGYVTKEVPGMLIWLGAGNPKAFGLHNPNMVLDESVFKLGSAIHASVAMKYLEDNSK